MENEELKHCVIQDIALLKLVSLKPIIVHGWEKIFQIRRKEWFKNGLRVSYKATTEVANMVLNHINKNLVHSLQNL